MNISKPVHTLTPDDFVKFPVWEYDLDAETSEGRDETWVRPVRRYPVTYLDNRVIGTSVLLNNGTRMTACLSNIALRKPESTREFLTLSLWCQEHWLDLARYFDVDYANEGPAAVALSLGLTVDDVFPIRYDIAQHAKGAESVIRGVVESQPKRRLTEDERMELIFEE
jgi:hypothetical protein